MGAVLGVLLKFVVPAIQALPTLISGIEALFQNRPKSGPQKWIAIEQALSGAIVLAAEEVVKIAPDGTKVDDVSGKIAVFSKAVNDAFVKLANDLGVFQTTS